MLRLPRQWNPDPTLSDIESLFHAMALAFEKAAAYYGFSCSGCGDNCCKSLFYHHTIAEYLFLEAGLFRLPKEDRASIFTRARDYVAAMSEPAGRDKNPRPMCPLNVSGRCILYEYRPMICRLFGLPHEFIRPGGQKIFGPGCHRFEETCSDKAYQPFDRTPYYRRMSEIETSLRKTTGIFGKVKMTVADMLVNMETGEE